MRVRDFWDLLGAIILLALIATVLAKKKTAADINALGGAFTGALSTAESGGSSPKRK